MLSGDIIGLRQRTASEEYRSRAISYVLAGGVVTAFVGPQLATVGIDLFEPVKFAGGYAAIMVIILVSMCVMQFVQIPRPNPQSARSGRPLLEIISQPKFVVALMSSMFGYAAMILMMTATPLAMQFFAVWIWQYGLRYPMTYGGHVRAELLTGHIIKRFGVLNIVPLGSS